MKLFQAFLLLSLLHSLPSPSQMRTPGRVTHIVDGDTIDVDIDGSNGLVTGDLISIRLVDIDCPGMSTAEDPVAKQFTTKWPGRQPGLP